MRKLIKDISVSEMEQMRLDGMSNREIADALDVSYTTVLAYIGKQPSGMRKYSKYTDDVEIIPSVVEAPACLVMQNKVIELHGLVGTYEINCKQQHVDVMYGETVLRLTFEEMNNFADELKAISRKLDSLNVEHEMW